MVHVARSAMTNLNLGLSQGRWAFPPDVRSKALDTVAIGDLLFFGVAGRPRGGGGFGAWQERRLPEAFLVRVTRLPFENKEPFWSDEVKYDVVRWNPTIEIELVQSFVNVPLAAGQGLSFSATDALYRGGVSHKAFRVSTEGSSLLEHAPPSVLSTPLVGRRSADQSRGLDLPAARIVAIESEQLRRAQVRSRPSTVADPVESRLVHTYARHLRDKGEEVARLRIDVTATETIYADVYSRTRHLLVEAKATPSRSAIRTAIGQLLDYGRYCEGASRAVLVPEQPSDDLLALLAAVDIGAIWRGPSGFLDTRRGHYC
ncbi:hypothetical protein Cwoe_5644 [Conexibacter woesei DSM 14684]|uniref:Uncharacterized protein n=2 Tax=Conexibacter TaxID=191494 RepID=D3F0W4_CONWI|nr:hypothetical protein Cwoe_5644 [Conexibacter woesei DSM 14684]